MWDEEREWQGIEEEMRKKQEEMKWVKIVDSKTDRSRRYPRIPSEVEKGVHLGKDVTI